MARKVTDIEINSETPPEELELCVHAADRSSERILEVIAATARAEKNRRSEQASITRSNAESEERVKAQKVQSALVERQIKAQEKWMAQQLVVAEKQAGTANSAVRVAVVLAILTGGLAVTAVIRTL